jgi:adenylylsulfate kinase
VTGLPASGKSEIAYELEKQLFDKKKAALVVDPDDGIGRGAPLDGSSPIQTPEFAHRATNAGLLAIFTYAMPLRADRAALRDAVGRERFVEVFASAGLDECKKRDQRGAYGPNHPDPSYERPQEADVEIDLGRTSAQDGAKAILAALEKKGLL